MPVITSNNNFVVLTRGNKATSQMPFSQNLHIQQTTSTNNLVRLITKQNKAAYLHYQAFLQRMAIMPSAWHDDLRNVGKKRILQHFLENMTYYMLGLSEGTHLLIRGENLRSIYFASQVIKAWLGGITIILHF